MLLMENQRVCHEVYSVPTPVTENWLLKKMVWSRVSDAFGKPLHQKTTTQVFFQEKPLHKKTKPLHTKSKSWKSILDMLGRR